MQLFSYFTIDKITHKSCYKAHFKKKELNVVLDLIVPKSYKWYNDLIIGQRIILWVAMTCKYQKDMKCIIM